MKKLSRFAAGLLLMSGLVMSCSKTETTPQSGNNNNNTVDTNFYFTAKVDGVDWKADMNAFNTFAEEPHSGFLSVSASLTTVTDGFFLMNVSSYSGAGTYTLGTGGGNSYVRYTTGTVANGSYSAWKAETPGSTTTGTLVVTKDENGIIEGTLEFDGYSEEKKTTKKITEGKFRMKKR